MSKGKSIINQDSTLDVIIVGGGINGAGIAAEATNRGLRVGLFEAKDFACATSSASSKLVHGGLRYLEYGEFRLVKEALNEREILLTKAAHLIKPMRFRLPHLSHLRPKWQIKAGLFLYDHLARRCILEASRQMKVDPADGLEKNITTAFEYSDCWIDDARLVIANLQQARLAGAEVRNYCQVIKSEYERGLWKVTIFDQRTNLKSIRYSRVLINATGPWAASFIEQYTPETSPHSMRLVKGSHLIVPKLYQGEHAYVLQNKDKRIVFVIPYLDRFSMIGTTDIPFEGDAYSATTSEEETAYLLSLTNQFFTRQLDTSDVIDSFSGVRPLFEDMPNDTSNNEQKPVSAQALSRDYDLTIQSVHNAPPLLTVFGGKLTTYRKLSVKVIKALEPFLALSPPQSEPTAPLPGSIGLQRAVLLNQVTSAHPSLAATTVARLVAQYGTAVWDVVKNAETHNEIIIADLHRFELDYLVENEWAFTADDIVRRRTKLHFDCDAQELRRLENELSIRRRSQNDLHLK
ncbi:glycerol-3-phosphate dehydrogenase [Vibrio scophthalmi]|uniref:glycerol-3-phosphate dehydrogenase n=1 Tax=Vibrio scophthalmi TaxID=45658 RepID=UPI00387351A7